MKSNTRPPVESVVVSGWTGEVRALARPCPAMKVIRPPFIAAILIGASHLICFAADVEGPYFAPGPDCEKAIVREIDAAKKSVYCQYYGFTADAVRDSLIAAKKRGVDVRVILDRSNSSANYSDGPQIVAAKIPTLVDSKHPIAHNKIAIIDSETVVTGSYNPSKAAHENAENVVVIRDKDIAEKYAANWKVHAEHSDPWGVRSQNRRTRK